MNTRAVRNIFGIVLGIAFLTSVAAATTTYAVGVDPCEYKQAQDYARVHGWDAVAIVWQDSNSANVECVAVDIENDWEDIKLHFVDDNNTESPNAEWFLNYNSIHFQHVGEKLHGNIKDNVPQIDQYLAL